MKKPGNFSTLTKNVCGSGTTTIDIDYSKKNDGFIDSLFDSQMTPLLHFLARGYSHLTPAQREHIMLDF